MVEGVCGEGVEGLCGEGWRGEGVSVVRGWRGCVLMPYSRKLSRFSCLNTNSRKFVPAKKCPHTCMYTAKKCHTCIHIYAGTVTATSQRICSGIIRQHLRNFTLVKISRSTAGKLYVQSRDMLYGVMQEGT